MCPALGRGECVLRWGEVSVPRGEEEEVDVPRRGGAGEVCHDGEEDVPLERRLVRARTFYFIFLIFLI